MKLTTWVAALALTTGASAFAEVSSAPVSLGAMKVGSSALIGTSTTGLSNSLSSYSDWYSFTLAAPAKLSISLLGSGMLSAGLYSSMTGAALQTLSAGSAPVIGAVTFNFASLGAGTYFAKLGLKSTSGLPALYGGTITALAAAAPVPEPQNVAMLLVGLAGLGWLQRRRNGR